MKSKQNQQSVFSKIEVGLKESIAYESGKSEPSGAAQRLLSIFKKDVHSLEKYELIKI